MASLLTNPGLEKSGMRIAGLGTTHIQAMTWDNATGAGGAFTATASKLSDGGATTSTSATTTATTVGTQTIQYDGTLTTAAFNGNNIGRISLHFLPAASVTTATTMLYGGIDQQTIAKTPEFSLVTQLQITYSSTQ